MKFSKMHGIGNDFVMVNGISDAFPWGSATEIAQKVCDRRFGIGSDGLIIAERGEDAPFKMRMLNPDGSESEMCGNGVRCFAQFVRSEGLTSEKSIGVETGAGLLTLQVLDEINVRVDMGIAQTSRLAVGMVPGKPDPFISGSLVLGDEEFLGSAVSMGNPHVVIFTDDASSVDLSSIGPRLEVHPFFPKKTNVHFVQVVSPTELIQRTWERGAGITLACGTGACACAVASKLNGYSGNEVQIHLPGGDLRIEITEEWRVFMTGATELVFEGDWSG